MSTQTVIDTSAASRERQRTKRAARATLWLFQHWLLVFFLLWGIYIALPFLAPVFMRLGWTGPAQLIYIVYSTQCHQMAQRSFFLFGPQPMYDVAQLPVQITGSEVMDMLTLRNFMGNADLGWKVAWSDRMVYMYSAMWLAAILFGKLRQYRDIRPLRLITFGLLLLPMAIDGGTHWLSDISGGLGGGFRYTNQWLADLTGSALPQWFYVGDAFGSFNSWMRLISGLAFGFAVVWLAFPYLDGALREAAFALREKLAGANQRIAAS